MSNSTHTHTQITSTSTLQEVLPGILQEMLQDVVLPEVSGAIFSFFVREGLRRFDVLEPTRIVQKHPAHLASPVKWSLEKVQYS